MENWIGIGIWIVLGALIGLGMRLLVALPDEQPGHTPLIAIFGAFGAVVGGMLGVGLLQFDEPKALSLGGMLGAVLLASLLTCTYRWAVRSLT